MFARLGEYVGRDDISAEEISAEFVAGFRQELEGAGLAPSTVSQMLRCFRAVAKEIFGADGREAFKEAFAAVESVNAKGAPGLGLAEIRRVAESNLDGIDMLRKVRDVWMLTFFGGGLSIDELRSAIDREETSGLPQERAICERFARDFGIGIKSFMASLSADSYAQGLDAIAYKLKLKCKLDEAAAKAAWEKVARRLRAEGDSRERLRERVADAVADVRPHWYVMRCLDGSPAETAEQIRLSGLAEDAGGTFDTFIAPLPSGKQAQLPGARMMARMLFFRCPVGVAEGVRKRMFDKAYVFTLSGASRPASIPDREMRVFMLLGNAGADAIAYHFPEYEGEAPRDFAGRRATISDGTFAGYSCTAVGAGHDRYKIAVKISGIGNLTITTEIPVEFLRFDEQDS